MVSTQSTWGSLCFCMLSRQTLRSQRFAKSSAFRTFSVSIPDVNFNDASVFAAKPKAELLRTIAIQSICKIKPLVSNANSLIKFGRKVVGDTVIDMSLKHTFFSHFCGGTNMDEVKVTMDELDKLGVGAILDYAAEYDLEDANMNSVDPTAELRYNCENLKSAVEAAACGSRQPYIAMKVTGLMPPETLLHFSTLAFAARSIFQPLTGVPVGSSLADATVSFEALKKALNDDEAVANEVFTFVGADKTKGLNYGEFVLAMSPTRVSTIPALGKFIITNCSRPLTEAALLTPSELTEVEQCIKFTEEILEAASKRNVRVLVDAEHVRVQAGIDLISMMMTLRFNQTKPVVMNTYQCYLKDAEPRLILDLAFSESRNLQFGAKVVRGAYMRHERQEAAAKGYADPVCSDKSTSDANYNSVVVRLLDAVAANKASVLLGTHNERSVQLAVEGMKARAILPSTDRVAFGQLLGMCDNITLKMGQLGFSSYKYVPYGPVKLVLPYLLRRAEENSDMLGSGGKELQMALKALSGGK